MSDQVKRGGRDGVQQLQQWREVLIFGEQPPSGAWGGQERPRGVLHAAYQSSEVSAQTSPTHRKFLGDYDQIISNSDLAALELFETCKCYLIFHLH